MAHTDKFRPISNNCITNVGKKQHTKYNMVIEQITTREGSRKPCKHMEYACKRSCTRHNARVHALES